MKSAWLPQSLLRAASLLAPGDQRAVWVKEWQSELWYVPRREVTQFCLGAFRDALWLRRNNLSPVTRTGIHLESPLKCLAFLAALAAASILIAVCLPAPQAMTRALHLQARDLPTGCISMLMLTCGLLPATWLAMGRTPAHRHPMPWPRRLRRVVFLALKVALVQPIMLCGLIFLVATGPIVPIAPNLGVAAIWVLTFRWVISDQRRRCPVCLRLLSDPVRIGTPSGTFLEWYGAESMCVRGHGLLHVPEMEARYSGYQQWLRLDDSWSGLFLETAGRRRP